MKYLTSEEILNEKSEEAHEILEKCTGKSVRDNFAFKVFDAYLEKGFGNNKHNLKILDLGPASGGFAKQINDSGYVNIYGADLDDYRIDINKKSFKEFKKCDLSWEKIPWSDGSFDVADAWCILPHLENPFFCVREIARVLKTGGVFIFTAPFLASKPSRDYFVKYGDFGSYKASNNHLVLFPPGVVEKSVLKYFDILGIEYHFRTKIFNGWKGQIRKIVFRIFKRMGDGWRKKIARRWAYNIFYILKKKEL
ncbi:MAG: class I SAM-dependent methyltransferase [Patescibacteria group bacterium]